MMLGRNKDRLSELPDSILHHIFSFLPTKQAVRASALSKRWRKFWVSIPNLSFHLNETRAHRKGNRFCMNYFNSFVYERDRQNGNSSSIERLHLHLWNFGPIRLEKCIYTAIRYNNIKEIDITLDAYGPCLTIPQPLFTSSPISIFRLKNLKSSITDLAAELPKSLLSAAHLKTLELVNIELPYLSKWRRKVVLWCPALEILVMVRCFFRANHFLSVSTPQLKKLVIDNDRIHYYDEDEFFDSVEIELDTPNLSSFVYRGGFSRYFHSLENLPKLISAEICALFWEDIQEDLEGTEAINVLNCLCNASTLALECFEYFPPQVTKLLGEALTSFTNLKTLELRTTTTDEAGFLLTKCSSIEALVLLLPESYPLHSKKNQRLVLHQQCSLNKLKYVAVRGVGGFGRELEFLRFLLDNALALEQMTITGYPLKNDDLLANYIEVLRAAQMTFGFKLLKLSRNFPTVKLSYKIL